MCVCVCVYAGVTPSLITFLLQQYALAVAVIIILEFVAAILAFVFVDEIVSGIYK